MAIPTQPTASTIATEAFQLYARRNPTSAEITRVTEYGIELVKSDIMDRGSNWDFLRTVSYQPITQYISTYQSPTDYKKLISVRLLKGTRSGTAQTGAATTLTLASTDSGGAETAGKWILITGGTGANQALQCKMYVSATKVATMETSWTTTPDNTSTYLVVDTFEDLDLHTVYDRSFVTNPGRQGQPHSVFHLADATEGDLVLDCSPSLTTYALELSYYADLLKMDTDTSTNPRYARVLRLLNGLFIQGVYTWLCQQDARYQIQRPLYEQKLQRAEGLYLYPNNESNMHSQVDY